MSCVSFVGTFPHKFRSTKDFVPQKRKYKEHNDKLYEEYKDHLCKLKGEFYPRYYLKQTIVHKLDEFNIINFINDGTTVCIPNSVTDPERPPAIPYSFYYYINVLGFHTVLGKYFAIKIIKKNTLIAAKRINEAKKEKRIALAIRFHFLAHMEYSCKDNLHIYFVYPYLTNEDLFTYLQRVHVLEERDAKFYCAQILLALEYLHNINIIHRNIKPENIIFMPNGYVKLRDFRFTKLIYKMRTYSFCGTPEYMAPEMILNKGYGKWVDWWSFGVLLYEMVAGHTPFYSSDPMDVIENIVQGKLKFLKKVFTDDCKNLIKNILHHNLSQRYGYLLNESLDIKCHDWFEIIDWQKIYSQTMNPPYIPKNIKPTSDPQKIDNCFLPDATTINTDTFDKEFEDF